jgi:hypothetical protein
METDAPKRHAFLLGTLADLDQQLTNGALRTAAVASLMRM